MNAVWRKASRSTSEGGACVELARFPATIGVRDSKDPEGPRVALPMSAVRELMTRIKRGELDG
ncbi:DUF397 domain-containing protein [Actinomadura rubrisoli]|uniref:DUF397 domain-containing protein n=1 Tax=Actinomadura rubrisoli TaxID=2530368 RepID=A0A4R4ZZZ7_9ACTN|nr:DUF397 domain-containing protein [Actinomadura rubrisoli]TDD64705.1 DUF397 domain-containing protein [Actinomadura rubrisoli]